MLKFLKRIVILLILIFIGYKAIETHQNVKQVMSYQAMVREVLDEQDTQANEELVLAMIYTETKGKKADVMQSSESATGEINSIQDNKESIRQGIQTLSDNLMVAEEKQVDVWTAVQAYNFGPAYIDFIADHGGENSVDLAKEYSRTVVAPSLGNVTGKTYFYAHPIALLHGSELYINGGNYYYSRQVRLNLYLIRLLGWF
ncbi:lysozyme family protein [Streptococcus himalayensis]|uniref:Pneumococcal vaccine antigen A n=1 Tax=Streptococcus himalayensis TaxID=1888195 RepID=A0A917A5B4_9STRE|nr:lysozyme family protein [Streptococcus himalayensis]GGE28516.1 hypothetical protein GCM10011510_07180 [Streptococcus himalayensis]